MLRLPVLLALLFLSSALSLSAAATDYDPARDFFPNTNAAGQVFTYGYSETDGSGFNLSTQPSTESSRSAWSYTASDMAVVHNDTSDTLYYNYAVVHPPEEIMFFPGNDGRKSIVRWTAPAAGYYRLNGAFTRRDYLATTGATVVVKGLTSSPLFSSQLTSDNSTAPFDKSVNLQAGDTIDFGIDRGADGNYSYDGTGLKLLITAVATGPGIFQTTVSGMDNIFLAPDGSTPASQDDGFNPSGIYFPAGSAQTVTFLGTDGAFTIDTTNDPLTDSATADGSGYQAPLWVQGARGLSGIKAPKTACLVGVFLGTGAIPASPALDFTAASPGTDFTSLAPKLGQVFFIGDGKTTAGQTQAFAVPAAATSLYLGVADGSKTGGASGGYANNGGFMHVVMQFGAGAPPPDISLSDFKATAPRLAGGAIAFSAKATHGASVRVQASTTPQDASSWHSLTDTTSGRMTESRVRGSFALTSTGYPAGATVSFRAIASLNGVDGPITSPLALTALHQPELKISATISTAQDPSLGSKLSPGDQLTVSLNIDNIGDAKASALYVAAQIPTYRGADDINKQFAATDIVRKSFGGAYLRSTTAVSKDAKVTWHAGDLDAGSSLTVSYVIRIPTGIKLDPAQAIAAAYAGTYSVRSLTAQPFVAVSGEDGAAPNLATTVVPAISVTVEPRSASASPGRLFTYRFTIKNLGTTAVSNPVGVIGVPVGARFDTAYPSGSATIPGAVYVGRTAAPLAPAAKLNFFGQVQPQIVLSLLGLAGAGDHLGRDRLTVDVTFQAQWISPAQQAQIALDHFRFAFLSPTAFVDPTTHHPVSPLASYAHSLLLASDAMATPSATDFFTLLAQPQFATGLFNQPNTPYSLPNSGSLAGQPDVQVAKILSYDPSDGLVQDEKFLPVVEPGDIRTFLLTVVNKGNFPAFDVFVTDVMFSKTAYVAGSATIISTGTSAKNSKLRLVPEVLPNAGPGTHLGQHLLFDGLEVEPHDALVISYKVRVNTGADAPLNNSYLRVDSRIDPDTDKPETCTVGTSSAPHTSTGLSLQESLYVMTNIVFPAPQIRRLVAKPQVAPSVSGAIDALDALYAASPNARPLSSASDLQSYLPGVERFYVHYENSSKAAIRNMVLTIPLPAHTAFYRAKFAGPLPAQIRTPGVLPEKVLAPPPNTRLSTPAIGAATGSVVANFTILAAGGSGDVMVEVIVEPDAVTEQGSFIGGSSGAPVNFTYAGSFGQDTPYPLIPVANHQELQAQSQGWQAQQVIPAVPEIGVFKSAPRTVNAGANFDVTFVLFNYGNSDAPSANFQFVQPPGTAFVQANYTTLYHGQFVIDGTSAVPGTDLEMFWDSIPAYSAVAVTYTLQATAAAGSTIKDTRDQLIMPYLGVVQATLSPIGVRGGDSLGELFFSEAGVPLHHFTMQGTDVFLLNVGGGNIVAEGAASLVPQGSNTLLSNANGRQVVIGAAANVGIGSSTAAFLLPHEFSASDLSPLGTVPGRVLVPEGATMLVPAGVTMAAAGSGLLSGTGATVINGTGSGLISQDGSGLISQDGSGLISQDGSGLISQDGSGLHSHDAGAVVSNDGGSLISQDGSGIRAALSGTSSLLSSHSGSLVAAGAGNFHTSP